MINNNKSDLQNCPYWGELSKTAVLWYYNNPKNPSSLQEKYICHLPCMSNLQFATAVLKALR